VIRIYDSGYRGDCRKEEYEQIDCASWLQYNHPDRWPLIWHVPNELTVDKKKPGWAQHLAKRQKMGVKNGVSDIIDFGAIRGAFELKRLDRSQSSPVTKDQRAFLKAADESGGFAAIVYGFEQFKLAYADYLAFIAEKS
jgi:hypothetical protein